MTALVLAMLLCTGLALAVVALVAIPARRQGRDLLTPHGEEVMWAIKDRTEAVLPRRGDHAAPRHAVTGAPLTGPADGHPADGSVAGAEPGHAVSAAR